MCNRAANRLAPGSRTVRTEDATRLWNEADLTLMSDREHPHFILRNDESVQRDISRLSIGDHELPNIAVHAPPEQRVHGQILDGRADCSGRRDRRVRVLDCQELEGALEMGQCPRRIDYRRQGFGRTAS